MDNLTLAKAKKLSFETGINIFSALAKYDERKGDHTFLSDLDTNLTLLNKYRECISRIQKNPSDAADAMETLKAMVWKDEYVQL